MLFREDDFFTALINRVLFGGPSTRYISSVFPSFVENVMKIENIESSGEELLENISKFMEKMHDEIIVFPV